MRIPAADIHHFSSAKQADAYNKATQLADDCKALGQSAAAFDNVQGIDFNVDKGAVVVVNADLKPAPVPMKPQQIELSKSQERWSELGHGATGNLLIDGSGDVKAMNLSNNGTSMRSYLSNGPLGLGQDRRVIEKTVKESVIYTTIEKACFFADGSVSYEHREIDRGSDG